MLYSTKAQFLPYRFKSLNQGEDWLYILLGKWIDHFNCEYKKAKFKAENADGVGTPARLSNAEICFFW